MDYSDFWCDSDYAKEHYQMEPPTPEQIRAVEEKLGYKLPASYIALMQQHNGGILSRDACPCDQCTTWSDDHVGVYGIYGIDTRPCTNSLCGTFGNQFWLDEWEYPPIGVAIADCPSGGHDMIFLDYRDCGPQGEPCVVHVDQECDYRITKLAPDFETFLGLLCPESDFSTAEETPAPAEPVKKAPGSIRRSLSRLLHKGR